MNEAIEGARDFQGFMERITADDRQRMRQAEQLRHRAAEPGSTTERRFHAMPDRQPGENRAAHRARLKLERREAKARKVPG